MLHLISIRLAYVLVFLTLASCSAIKEKVSSEPDGWLEQQQQLQQFKVWEVRGRLGVQTEETGGSADLIWKQSNQDYSIRLILPLGAGSYLIEGNDQGAVVRYPNGQKRQVSNIDNVFSSILGVSLPVSAIRDWVRGLPARSMTVETIQWNDQGLLDTIKQSGWTVEMTDYEGSELLLPHSVYLSREDNEELDIRLVLRQWLVDSN